MLSSENEKIAAGVGQATTSGPRLIFVLGAPCSGKSTLCAVLAKHYNLDHFSLGEELRSLVSDTLSGHAARIRPLFSASELATFRSNLYAGTLGPVHLTPKYVKERIFPAGCNPQNVRMLIDGFPQDAKRWAPFKKFAKPIWTPSKSSILIVLEVKEDVALERFINRSRPGDVFKARFDEHKKLISEVVEAMSRDEMIVLTVGNEDNDDVEATVNRLAGLLG